MSIITEMYEEGYADGYKEAENHIRDRIQNYINELIGARCIVATGVRPEYNGPFGAAVADGQKTVLDNVISRLEGIITDNEEED